MPVDRHTVTHSRQEPTRKTRPAHDDDNNNNKDKEGHRQHKTHKLRLRTQKARKHTHTRTQPTPLPSEGERSSWTLATRTAQLNPARCVVRAHAAPCSMSEITGHVSSRSRYMPFLTKAPSAVPGQMEAARHAIHFVIKFEQPDPVILHRQKAKRSLWVVCQQV